MLIYCGKSVSLPSNAVRAYKISTIVDAVADAAEHLRTVRAYEISTIVDGQAAEVLLQGAVRAY